jgi:hypothetical protein
MTEDKVGVVKGRRRWLVGGQGIGRFVSQAN